MSSSRFLLYACAFWGGAVVLVVELAAVRLLAPWFGASSTVWTHVIGVILLALSAGYALGARWAQHQRAAARLALALFVAAGLVVWMPSLARWVGEWLMPPGLSLDRASNALGWGSLAAAVLLFGPAALLLSTLAPIATELLQRERGGSAGAAGGQIMAVGTLGSLLGSFATTYWLLPEWGLSWTYRACALVLVALGLAMLAHARTARSSAAWSVLAISGSLWATPANSSLPAGTRLLEAVQSRYQAVRVVERGADAQLERWLQVNEGLDSFQSVWKATPGLLGPGYYYDGFALPPAWSQRESGRWNTLVLGLGAGSVWRVLQGTLPPSMELCGDGVEIDEAVVELGMRWMDLEPSSQLRVHSGIDARVALQALVGPYDQIIVDAYANQLEIPAHLASAEFLELAWSRLAEGGWLCLNVGAFGEHDPLLQAIGETLAQATNSPVLALSIPFSRNVLLLARRAATWPAPGSPSFSAIQPPQLAAWADSMSLAGCWWVYQPSGQARLSDDHAPLEALQRASLNFAQGAR